MALPETNIKLSDVKAALSSSENGLVALSKTFSFNPDTSVSYGVGNVWSPRKPINPTFATNQLAGYLHGLYRDSNGKLQYNAPPTTGPYRLGDFRGYDHSSESPSYFVIDSIKNDLGEDALVNIDGCILYSFMKYTVKGVLRRGTIDPLTISALTAWTKQTTTDGYGGICFGIRPNTNGIASEKVHSVVAADVEIEFTVTPEQDWYNNNPLGIWYCQRLNGLYSSTSCAIENRTWEPLSIEDYKILIYAKTFYRSGGKLYLSFIIANEFTGDYAITPYLYLLSWIIAGGVTYKGILFGNNFVDASYNDLSSGISFQEVAGSDEVMSSTGLAAGEYLKVIFLFNDLTLPTGNLQLDGVHIQMWDHQYGGVAWENDELATDPDYLV